MSAVLNAAENPFRVSRIEALPYRAPDFDWGVLLERLAAMQYRGAIIGPHGHGKTTLLNELARRLAKQGRRPVSLFLNDEQPRFAPGALRELRHSLGPRDIVLLDGAEQLRPWAWLQFLFATRTASGLLITAHRPGRLRTLYECRTSLALFEELLQELLPAEGLARKHARTLFQQYRKRPVNDVRS